ncbi:MAG: diaminopimelate epimerase [Pseudomonadota bacterium]
MTTLANTAQDATSQSASSRLAFTKMHGLGNDFVMINGVANRVVLTASQVRAIADRRTGVGCDQLLIVEPSTHPQADFDYRIYNADGGEVEHCGNGARCFAQFVRAEGLTDKTTIPVNTCAGLIELYVEDANTVTVNMGVPTFEPDEIPFVAAQREAWYSLRVGADDYRVGAAAIGNPHTVLDVDDVDAAAVETLGPAIETHAQFPQRVNVGFRQVVNPGHIRLRVFERGVGETRACGTGACAAVVIGQVQDVLGSEVRVSLPGGDLVVHWRGEGEPVTMTGPTNTVFSGTLDVPQDL